MEAKVYIFSILTFVLITKVIDGFSVETSTSAGVVQGNIKYLKELNKTIEVYLSIRYAMAPIKELRFKDPVPLPKNSLSNLGSSEFPPTCPQLIPDIFKGFKGMEVWEIESKIDEDCLFLNIWKPRRRIVKMPVIVWIHCGGFGHGSTSLPLYDGSYLSAWTNAIVVSIQYRLGALGFLYTGDDFAPGNAGLKDQVLALKWVYEHIDAFGGDKEKITIFGDSAGSASVGFHAINPETSKLFKQTIMLSGSPNCPWAVISPSEAKRRATSLASKLGANISNHEEIKKCLLERKWEDIVEGTNMLDIDSVANLVFWPTIEPILVPTYPSQMLKNSKHLKGKEMIASFVKDESSMFLAIDMNSLKRLNLPTDTPNVTKEDLLKKLEVIAGRDDDIMKELLEIYNKTSYLDGVMDLGSDLEMKCPINEFIEESRKMGATVYQFVYNHGSLSEFPNLKFKIFSIIFILSILRSQNNPWPEWMGTVHTADLEMFFGRPIYQRELFNDKDVVLSENFMNRIKNFVQTGNPNVPGLENWDKEGMVVIGERHADADNRISICNKLKKLKKKLRILPVYTSKSSRWQFDLLGFLVPFLYFWLLI